MTCGFFQYDQMDKAVMDSLENLESRLGEIGMNHMCVQVHVGMGVWCICPVSDDTPHTRPSYSPMALHSPLLSCVPFLTMHRKQPVADCLLMMFATSRVHVADKRRAVGQANSTDPKIVVIGDQLICERLRALCVRLCGSLTAAQIALLPGANL